MAFNYFDSQTAIYIHDQIIDNSGGFHGYKDLGLLESTLYHLENDFYYPDLEHKLTHLLFSINKNHCFSDGNKRASLSLCTYFLTINNLSALVEKFTLEMENIVVDVANNIIDRDLLFEIIYSKLYEAEFSDELKLKIMYAKLAALDDNS
jgi:death-on-curing protein